MISAGRAGLVEVNLVAVCVGWPPMTRSQVRARSARARARASSMARWLSGAEKSVKGSLRKGGSAAMFIESAFCSSVCLLFYPWIRVADWRVGYAVCPFLCEIFQRQELGLGLRQGAKGTV